MTENKTICYSGLQGEMNSVKDRDNLGCDPESKNVLESSEGGVCDAAISNR